jgi:hypothetical protein
MTKIHLIECITISALEDSVNEWLEENAIREIVDIKYNSYNNNQGVPHHVAVITYKTH